jgi:hypothetical protein
MTDSREGRYAINNVTLLKKLKHTSKLQTESADQFKFYQIQDILNWEISEKVKVHHHHHIHSRI